MPAVRAGPLAGIRVIDHCSHWAGPLATCLLGGLGAEVIKVEAIQRYDGARLMRICRPGPDGHEWSAAFNGYNHAKLGFTVNLDDERGHRIFLDLARVSDVVVESYRPGSALKLGIGYEQLSQVNPRLIYASLDGFGSEGPLAGRTGYGATFTQLAGVAAAHAYRGERPNGDAAVPYSDVFNAAIAVFSIITALRSRDATGQGQIIEQAQVEITALLGIEFLMDSALNQRVQEPDGNRKPGPENVYLCQPGDEQEVIIALANSTEERPVKLALDEWISIDVDSDLEWTALCGVASGESFADDPRYLSIQGRREHLEDLDRDISNWTRKHNAFELASTLQAVGVSAVPVANQSQALAIEHFHDRGDIKLLDRPVSGAHLYVGFPFHFERSVAGWDTASPTLGADNLVVLKEILGRSDQEIAQLQADEVIGNEPTWHPVT